MAPPPPWLRQKRHPAPAVSAAEVDAGAQELDSKFEKMAAWSVVKREFPDWYGEQLRQAAKLTAEKQPEQVVNKQLAEALVALRRQHANDALSASTARLKDVATTFLNNLKALASQNVEACYGFISQGETSPAVLEVLQSPAQGAAVQAAGGGDLRSDRRRPQIADHARQGRQGRLRRAGAGADQARLEGERPAGILQSDAAVARAAGRVCQMVQDWFFAHLSVADQGTQERLLVETLKPVVSG